MGRRTLGIYLRNKIIRGRPGVSYVIVEVVKLNEHALERKHVKTSSIYVFYSGNLECQELLADTKKMDGR